MENKKTIFVVDDDLDTCESLRFLFESVHLNVETYGSAKSYLEKYDPNREGCLILDVRMPVMSGLELLDKLKTQKCQLRIIMITGHGDIPMAVRAMKAGAVDFVLKPINHQYLLETIQTCLKGRERHSEIASNAHEKLNCLSERERQVMDLIADGKLNKEIAHDLKISLSTVEAHRSRIMHKMQVKNVAQLIKVYLLCTSMHDMNVY